MNRPSGRIVLAAQDKHAEQIDGALSGRRLCRRPYSEERYRAYTLIELLIVMMIMSLMALLFLSGVKSVRERAKQQACQNNLREIGMAFDHYEYLWGGRLPPTTGPEDDNLRPLYPDCVNALEIFICQETGNQVDEPVHLEDNAVGGRTAGVGHSYEYLSYYLYDAEGNKLEQPEMKTRASVDIRADKTWLVMDAMEAGMARLPDMFDNHYDVGGNVLFADSHVEWIARGKWIMAFKNGNSK